MRPAVLAITCALIGLVRQECSAGSPFGPPRNFDAVYPRADLEADALAAAFAPHGVIRPWYLSPYRNYAYYRPWYTYGYYGPTRYRYHYAPSWGYQQPWYGPQYLNPDAIAPPAGEQLYHW
jgi:hypothetical protein